MKRFLVLTLCLITLLSSTACGSKNPPSNKDAKVITLNTFETQADLDTMTLAGVLGKAELNTQSSFVKKGNGSLKVTVISNPYKSAQPSLYQAMNLEKAGIDCTDFSKVEHFTIEVYNAQTMQRRIGLQMVFTDSYNKGITEWFTLKPSGWTTVKYTIAREFIPQIKNVSLVTGMNLIFDRGTEDEVYYLDEVKVYKTDKGFTPVTMSLEKDEICSFDKLWQVQKLGFECYDGAELIPSASYVKDNTATGKGSALKLETVPGSGANRWPGIVLNEEMLKLVDWASYGDNDKFCFDVYTPAINGLDKVYLNLYCNGVRFASMEGVSLKRGEWITISYTVKDFNGLSNSPSLNFSKVTGVKVFYLEHTGKSKIVYFDNFRMERAS